MISRVKLPRKSAAAIANAEARFIEHGLHPALAAHHAQRYARKLSARQRGQLRRHQGTPLSKAAARNERAMYQLTVNAIRKAQAEIDVEKLVASLTMGEIPWHELEPAIAALEKAL
jgi:hypothetical protein